jgi:ribosomal protein S18 acetylase RimI-like enzyme
MPIRPAALSDLPAVSALLAETWHATYDDLYGAERVADITRRWHSIDALAQGLGRPDTCFLVALAKGDVTGTISVVRRPDGTLELKRLYVLPQAQGGGIGSRLLAAALAVFPDAPAIGLEVEPANAQAIRFYERKGFTVNGKTSDCTGSGDRIPALVMTRALKPRHRDP